MLETAEDVSAELPKDTSEAIEKETVKPACATIEEFKQLLDEWDAQCVQERFEDTRNRASDLLKHVMKLHGQHGDVFGDIMVQVQACHSLLHTREEEESSLTSEASGWIDRLCHESWILEEQTKCLKSSTSSMSSLSSDASTRASRTPTGVCSTTREISILRSP